jgi:dihydroorotase
MMIIKGGRVIDPKEGVDKVLDLLIVDGKIQKIEEAITLEEAQIIDAEGKIVAPGFIDLHVHFREPGFEYKETIQSGTRAAAKGGFTTVACMPNTNPAIHSKEVVDYIKSKVRQEGVINVFPIGSITQNIAGKKLAPIKELVQAGVVAISDDGKTTMDFCLMESACQEAKALGIPIIDHCEDHRLSRDGSVNEGKASQRTGIKGIPAKAEWAVVERDIMLAKTWKTPMHIAHISTKESIALIRKAKKEGVLVTCEVAPHHFTLTDEVITKEDTYTKVNPPIRSKEDVEAIIHGIMDGTIDIIATDHAPHDEASKRKDYKDAAFGISGIETAFSISYTELVLKRGLSLYRLIEMMSSKPAGIIGIDKGSLAVGQDADIVILDLDSEEVIDSHNFLSKGKNTPFNGRSVKGKPVYTIVNGKIIMDGGNVICL